MGGIGGNRRRRAGLWIAGLAVIAAIATTYQLTRPPALVWWTSPRLGSSIRHIRMLVPNGWELHSPIFVERGVPAWKHFPWHAQFRLLPHDNMPALIRRILRRRLEDAELTVEVYQTTWELPRWALKQTGIERRDNLVDPHQAYRVAVFREAKVSAGVVYRRTDLRAFNETYTAICNSLRIE